MHVAVHELLSGKRKVKTFYLDQSPLDNGIKLKKIINKKLDTCEESDYEKTEDLFGINWEIEQKFMFCSKNKFSFTRFVTITPGKNWQYCIKLEKATTTFSYKKDYKEFLNKINI